MREEIEKILDENISYGYEFQMSDYAVCKDDENEYYKRGREEVKEATDQILTLLDKEIQKARVDELERLTKIDCFNEVYTTDVRPGKIVKARIKQLEKE